MSFSNEIKERLTDIKIKSNCCKKAFVLGVVYGTMISRQKKQEENDRAVLFFTEEKILAEKVSDHISKYLRHDAELHLKKICGKSYVEVSVPMHSVEGILLMLSGVSCIDSSDFMKCDSCRQCFLRGLFVSCASLSDPASAYHLEFLSKDADAGEKIRDFLNKNGLSPSGRSRIYYKSAEGISQLLAYVGARHESFDVMNLQIERQIRSEENRITNCEARNIQRSITAAMQQIDAITFIIAEGAEERLPKELRATLNMRLDNPDACLSELALMHEPPITKSGLNHRLAKIMAFYEELKKEKNITS